MPNIDKVSIEGMSVNNIKRSPTGGLTGPTDSWQLVALYEILVELRKLNALLHCSNFQAVPSKLERIARNTAKPRRTRKAKAP